MRERNNKSVQHALSFREEKYCFSHFAIKCIIEEKRMYLDK